MKQHTSKVGDALLWNALRALVQSFDSEANAIRTTGGGGGGGGPDVGCPLLEITPASGPTVSLSINGIRYCQTISAQGGTQVAFYNDSAGLLASTSASVSAVLAALREADQWGWMQVAVGAGDWLLLRPRDLVRVDPVGSPDTGTATFGVTWRSGSTPSQSSYRAILNDYRLAGCQANSERGRCSMEDVNDPKPSPSIASPLVILTIPPGLLQRAMVSKGALELVTADDCIVQCNVNVLRDSDDCIIAEATDQVQAACENLPAEVAALLDAARNFAVATGRRE